MNNYTNDTLLMIIWEIRQKPLYQHASDVQQRYAVVFDEIIKRKQNETLSDWEYKLVFEQNDLNFLKNVDKNIVSAFITPVLSINNPEYL